MDDNDNDNDNDNGGGGRSEGGGDMRAFVLHAWESSGKWHPAPGQRWELRFPSRNRLFGGPEFELRDAESNATHGYRRARRGAAPERVGEDARGYDDPSTAGFSEDEKSFAHAVAGVLDEWPDSRRADDGLAAVMAELVRWYLSALESDELSRRQRFKIALFGTSTFSVALMISMALVRTSSELHQDFQKSAYIDLYNTWLSIALLFLSVFTFIFAYLFAVLCSWKSRVNGPLRIYAISFLSYYAIWRISYAVWSMVSSEGVGVGAGSSS